MTSKGLNDAEVDCLIGRKGLTAPRVTESQIDSVIQTAKYVIFEGTQLTLCCLVLKNGFTVTGESSCASPENFDQEIGKGIALKNARNKIWELEGYLLKEKLYQQSLKELNNDSN